MSFVVETFAEKYKQMHQSLRNAIANLSPEALDWQPATEANSIQVLIVHTLGSEAEVWRLVAKEPSSRDRLTEFVPSSLSSAQLLVQLEEADQLVDEMSKQVDDASLHDVLPRGNQPPQSGLGWLVQNYGHAREHAAHIELTIQLFNQHHPSNSND